MTAARESFARYYEILGVSVNASQDDIKKQYLLLAKNSHPDKNKNSTASTQRFREINEAYEKIKQHKAGMTGPADVFVDANAIFRNLKTTFYTSHLKLYLKDLYAVNSDFTRYVDLIFTMLKKELVFPHTILQRLLQTYVAKATPTLGMFSKVSANVALANDLFTLLSNGTLEQSLHLLGQSTLQPEQKFESLLKSFFAFYPNYLDFVIHHPSFKRPPVTFSSCIVKNILKPLSLTARPLSERCIIDATHAEQAWVENAVRELRQGKKDRLDWLVIRDIVTLQTYISKEFLQVEFLPFLTEYFETKDLLKINETSRSDVLRLMLKHLADFNAKTLKQKILPCVVRLVKEDSVYDSSYELFMQILHSIMSMDILETGYYKEFFLPLFVHLYQQEELNLADSFDVFKLVLKRLPPTEIKEHLIPVLLRLIGRTCLYGISEIIDIFNDLAKTDLAYNEFIVALKEVYPEKDKSFDRCAKEDAEKTAFLVEIKKLVLLNNENRKNAVSSAVSPTLTAQNFPLIRFLMSSLSAANADSFNADILPLIPKTESALHAKQFIIETILGPLVIAEIKNPSKRFSLTILLSRYADISPMFKQQVSSLFIQQIQKYLLLPELQNYLDSIKFITLFLVPEKDLDELIMALVQKVLNHSVYDRGNQSLNALDCCKLAENLLPFMASDRFENEFLSMLLSAINQNNFFAFRLCLATIDTVSHDKLANQVLPCIFNSSYLYSCLDDAKLLEAITRRLSMDERILFSAKLIDLHISSKNIFESPNVINPYLKLLAMFEVANQKQAMPIMHLEYQCVDAHISPNFSKAIHSIP